MKNRSIGSLILVALLAPSCGGGGGGGGSKHSITLPRWEEVYRRPTSVDLRVVRFGNPSSGIVAGKHGTFVRTDDGGNSWYSLESTPVQVGNFDVLAMAVSNITTFAVGGTPAGAATYTNCIAWQSLDATTFVQPDSPQSFTGEAWVDVIMTGAATSTLAASTLRLRPDGLLDLCQGSILGTKNSKDSDTTAAPPNNAPGLWTSANGMSIGSSSLWVVCGDNGGFGQIRFTLNANLETGTFFANATLPSATTPVLRRIGMVSSTQGFSVGDGGTVLTVNQSATPTSWTWTNVNAHPGALSQNLRAMYFFDANTGWVAGDGGTIYRITNASSLTPTWTSIATSTGENLYDIYFVDPDNGYAVGNNGIVLKITGGSTGSPTCTIKSGPAVNPTAVFNAVDFSASASVGLAVGNSGTLMRSLNGGLTWSSFNTGPGATPLSANLTAVSIPRQGTNTVAFVGTDNGGVYYNTDLLGSGTWQLANSNNYPAAVIRTLLFPKGDTAGIVAGDGGNFAHLTFTPAVVAPPTPASLAVATQVLSPAPGGAVFAAACDPPGNTLYLGGDAGYLVKSVNGGTTWAAVTGGPSGSIRALQAPTGPNFTLFAGVNDDKVYSLSVGNAWASGPSSGLGTPSGMAFIDDLHGWVVTQGANGGIRFTVDGGGTWFISYPHVPTTGSVLNAIWMSPSGFGVIVGANGLIMKTTTGGQ